MKDPAKCFDELHEKMQDTQERLAPFVEIVSVSIAQLAVQTQIIARDADEFRKMLADASDEGMPDGKLSGVRASQLRHDRAKAASVLFFEAQLKLVEAVTELNREATQAEIDWVFLKDKEVPRES